jgi:hypothetical protein
MMIIPTEPIGGIPRPLALIEAVARLGDNADPRPRLTAGPFRYNGYADRCLDFAMRYARVSADEYPLPGLHVIRDDFEDAEPSRESARALGVALAAEMIGGR